MKVITTGLLNRFWTKGIKPWLDKRIKSYADLMVTTASGYTPDALAVKEGFTELNGKLDNKIDSNRFVMSSTGSISGFVKNNEVWIAIFNRISTPDSCVCVVSRYADVVSVYPVSKSATMNIEYNDQGTITVKYNGSANGVFCGAFKFFG